MEDIVDGKYAKVCGKRVLDNVSDAVGEQGPLWTGQCLGNIRKGSVDHLF